MKVKFVMEEYTMSSLHARHVWPWSVMGWKGIGMAAPKI